MEGHHWLLLGLILYHVLWFWGTFTTKEWGRKTNTKVKNTNHMTDIVR